MGNPKPKKLSELYAEVDALKSKKQVQDVLKQNGFDASPFPDSGLEAWKTWACAQFKQAQAEQQQQAAQGHSAADLAALHVELSSLAEEVRGYRAENRELRKDVTQLASRVLALETSQDYAAKDIKDLQKSNKALQDSLDALRTSQNAQQAALVAQPMQDGVIMSGLLEEEEDTDRLMPRVTAIFEKEMVMEEKVEVKEIQRLGSADGAKKPRTVLVTLKNAQQVIAVHRAARTLRDRNIKAKEAGELPIGLDRNLSVEERMYRSSIWGNFKPAK
ncbi:g5883 [Coccomyxa elongata]